MRDLTALIKDAVSPKDKKPPLPEIFKRIRKHWLSFQKRDPNPVVWSKEEGLEGLCPPNSLHEKWDKAVAVQALDEIIACLPTSPAEFEAYDSDTQTYLIASLLLGIRLGNALGKESNDS